VYEWHYKLIDESEKTTAKYLDCWYTYTVMRSSVRSCRLHLVQMEQVEKSLKIKEFSRIYKEFLFLRGSSTWPLLNSDVGLEEGEY